MDARFDIFQKLPDGHPLWIQTVDGLEEAKSQLLHLSTTSPGEYFIYNSQKGSVIQMEMAAGAEPA